MFVKSNLKRSLRNGKCRVQFTSVTTGKTRDMICTLSEDFIPVKKQPKTDRGEAVGVINVFDVIKKDWRSFHVNEVKKFSSKVTPEEETFARNALKA
jgi:WYL_2, Sm-like SH3 beta-barrel fold